MKRSLEEIGAEYLQCVEILTQRIAKHREKLKKQLSYSNRATILRAELNILYREREEARKIAEYLKNYYF